MVKMHIDTLGIVTANDDGKLEFENQQPAFKEVRDIMQSYYDTWSQNGHISQTELLTNGARHAFGIDRSEISIIIPETNPPVTHFDSEINIENKIVE